MIVIFSADIMMISDRHNDGRHNSVMMIVRAVIILRNDDFKGRSKPTHRCLRKRVWSAKCDYVGHGGGVWNCGFV